MTRRSLAFALVPTALIAIACSSGTEASDTAAPRAPAAASESPLHFPAWERANSPCCPWRPIPAANVAAYIAAMKAIDPGLTQSLSGSNREERAVSRGENTCLDMKGGKPEAALIKNTAARFDGGDASVDEAKAKRILPLIRKYLCPKL